MRVHRWVEGVAAPPPVAAKNVARWAGRTLAVLHGLRLTPADRGLFPVPDAGTADRWAELTEAARRGGVAWAELLARAAAAVATVAALVRAGGHDPAAEGVMSHADVSCEEPRPHIRRPRAVRLGRRQSRSSPAGSWPTPPCRWARGRIT